MIKDNKINTHIRPAVTIIFTLGVWVAFALGKLNGDILIGMYGTILGFWFGERAVKKKGE